MGICIKCGKKYDAGDTACPHCGAAIVGEEVADPKDAESNKVMAVLAYLGFLVLVPIFAAKESRFARYHANQGLVLAILEIAYGIIVSIITTILYAISLPLGLVVSGILGLLWLVFLVFLIIGIMNAAKGQMKPLPIIGGIRILK